MTRTVDWQFWTIVALISVGFLLAFVSVSDEPVVSAGEIPASQLDGTFGNTDVQEAPQLVAPAR